MALAKQLTFSDAVQILQEIGIAIPEDDWLSKEALDQVIDLLEADRCLVKLQPGEAYFVFRARDILAPSAIKYWLSQIENTGSRLSEERILEISDIVRAMESYPDRKVPD